MNSEQPGRARRVLIVREDGAQESWVREDDFWRDQITNRGSMPSDELLKRIREAIGVEDVS
jgi:hypothetical protein